MDFWSQIGMFVVFAGGPIVLFGLACAAITMVIDKSYPWRR